HDYKVIFVGDASMSPYEIVAPGGSVEHFNEEPGRAWMERVVATYPSCVWLNPVPEREWETTGSIRLMRQLLAGRMLPSPIGGLDEAMRELTRQPPAACAAYQPRTEKETAMPAERFDFPNSQGHKLAALLDRPDGPIRAVALFAHCFT